MRMLRSFVNVAGAAIAVVVVVTIMTFAAAGAAGLSLAAWAGSAGATPDSVLSGAASADVASCVANPTSCGGQAPSVPYGNVHEYAYSAPTEDQALSMLEGSAAPQGAGYSYGVAESSSGGMVYVAVVFGMPSTPVTSTPDAGPGVITPTTAPNPVVPTSSGQAPSQVVQAAPVVVTTTTTAPATVAPSVVKHHPSKHTTKPVVVRAASTKTPSRGPSALAIAVITAIATSVLWLGVYAVKRFS